MNSLFLLIRLIVIEYSRNKFRKRFFSMDIDEKKLLCRLNCESSRILNNYETIRIVYMKYRKLAE